MTQYLLEGMALSRMIGGLKVPEQMIMDWLKAELQRSYQDVRTVKRPRSK
jgi:hypothetical protein